MLLVYFEQIFMVKLHSWKFSTVYPALNSIQIV